MALTDYAQKRAERVWVRAQDAVGVFAMPTERDAVKIRGAATLPATGSEFAPSEEVTDTPTLDQLLKRKKPPSEFSLTVYAKVPTTPGVLPQWDALMRNSYGSSEFVTTLGTGTLGGAALTVTLDGVPTVVPLVAAGGDAEDRATALAAAVVAAVPGVSATADGAVVRLSARDGAGELRLSTNAAPNVLALGAVRYTLRSDITERLLSIVHGTDNGADYYRDCIVSNVLVRALGTDEASITFTGFLGNSTSSAQTKVGAGGIPAHDAVTPVTFPLESVVAQIGPTAEDAAYLSVDGEVFKITETDDNADPPTVTALGGQFGTTPATKPAGAEVLPYLPGPDPDANDAIIGLTLGAWTAEGEAHRIISIESTKDERINPRIDEAFEPALTGYRRPIEARVAGGTLLAYQRRAILALTTYSEREKVVPAKLRLGPATGPRIEVDWPKFRLGKVDKGEQGGEFTRSFPFRGLGTQTPGNDEITLTVYAA